MVLDAHTACCSVVALFVMQADRYVGMQCAHGHGLATLRANDVGGCSDLRSFSRQFFTACECSVDGLSCSLIVLL